MKEQICAQFETLLQNEDITAVKAEAKSLQNDYKAETAKEKQIQEEAWKQLEHEEGEEFEYQVNPLDERFEALVADYKERVKIFGQQLAEERQNNLTAKLEILKALEALVAHEEHIGKAFSAFKELIEKWNAIGDIPGDKHRELADQLHRIKEDFYYNINIYRELQENDLKINLKKKEELIEKAAELSALESIREIETLVRSYRKSWDEIGPSPRESYKELGDKFFDICRGIYDKIQAYYEEIHAEQDANLLKKQELVKQLKLLVGMEITHHNTWKKKTDEVLALQNEWKEVGFARKKDNEEVWQEFRGLCDLFFDKKKAYYKTRKAEGDTNKKLKQAIIEKARTMADSTDWKKTTESLIELQKKWKTVGPANQSDEHQLWKDFRAVCDAFFEGKKKHFKEMDGEQNENLKAKKALIEEIEKSSLSGNKAQDLAMLQEFSNRWNAIGYVPKSALSGLFDSYNAALDGKYASLKMERAERNMDDYKGRVENMKQSGDADYLLKKEKFQMREKIDRLKQHIMQYENNLEIFTGKGAAALKKDIEKKIRHAQKEIEEIKAKMSLLQ